jgi:hypothetical protein
MQIDHRVVAAPVQPDTDIPALPRQSEIHPPPASRRNDLHRLQPWRDKPGSDQSRFQQSRFPGTIFKDAPMLQDAAAAVAKVLAGCRHPRLAGGQNIPMRREPPVPATAGRLRSNGFTR